MFGGGSGDGEGVGEGVGVSKALVVTSGSTKVLGEEGSTKVVVMSKTEVKTSETLGVRIELMLSSDMEDVRMKDVSCTGEVTSTESSTEVSELRRISVEVEKSEMNGPTSDDDSDTTISCEDEERGKSEVVVAASDVKGVSTTSVSSSDVETGGVEAPTSESEDERTVVSVSLEDNSITEEGTRVGSGVSATGEDKMREESGVVDSVTRTVVKMGVTMVLEDDNISTEDRDDDAVTEKVSEISTLVESSEGVSSTELKGGEDGNSETKSLVDSSGEVPSTEVGSSDAEMDTTDEI